MNFLRNYIFTKEKIIRYSYALFTLKLIYIQLFLLLLNFENYILIETVIIISGLNDFYEGFECENLLRVNFATKKFDTLIYIYAYFSTKNPMSNIFSENNGFLKNP